MILGHLFFGIIHRRMWHEIGNKKIKDQRNQRKQRKQKK